MAQLLIVKQNSGQYGRSNAKRRDMLHRRGDVVVVHEDKQHFGLKTLIPIEDWVSKEPGDEWRRPPDPSQSSIIIDVPGVPASVFRRLVDGVKHTGEDITIARKARFIDFSLLPAPKRAALFANLRVSINRAILRRVIVVRPLHRPDHDTLIAHGV